MVGLASHPGTTISIEGATHSTTSESLVPGYFFVDPIEYNVVFTPMDELNDHDSLELLHAEACKRVQELKHRAIEAAKLAAESAEEATSNTEETDDTDDGKP